MIYIKAYFGFLFTFLIVDAVWIQLVVRTIYQQDVPHLLSDSPDMLAAAVFYLFYAVGAVVLTVKPALVADNAMTALMLGGLFGALAYGTFTMTNYSMMDGWTLKIVITDILWGTVLTAGCALAGYSLASRF